MDQINQNAIKNARDAGIDITRIAAFISVVAVHFFLNSGFYDTPVVGERMFIMVVVRSFCMICVPLFMLITGYLYSERKIPITFSSMWKHLSKLQHVILIYVVSAFFKFLFRSLYLGQKVAFFKDYLLVMLGYSQYGWYVNMYIGMFILIPFLNLLWQTLDNKEGRRSLILILMSLTVAPSIFNIYDLSAVESFFRPWTATGYTQIVPDWWDSIYPITYYYLGAYLKSDVDMKKIRTGRLVGVLLLIVAIFGLYNYWRSYSVNFIKGPWCHPYGSLQNTTMSVLTFLVINSVHYPSWILQSKIVKKVAALTFGGYLLSWIPDKMLYPILKQIEPQMSLRFNYFPVMVVLVTFMALILSYSVDMIIKVFTNLCRRGGHC